MLSLAPLNLGQTEAPGRVTHRRLRLPEIQWYQLDAGPNNQCSINYGSGGPTKPTCWEGPTKPTNFDMHIPSKNQQYQRYFDKT